MKKVIAIIMSLFVVSLIVGCGTWYYLVGSKVENATTYAIGEIDKISINGLDVKIYMKSGGVFPTNVSKMSAIKMTEKEQLELNADKDYVSSYMYFSDKNMKIVENDYVPSFVKKSSYLQSAKDEVLYLVDEREFKKITQEYPTMKKYYSLKGYTDSLKDIKHKDDVITNDNKMDILEKFFEGNSKHLNLVISLIISSAILLTSVGYLVVTFVKAMISIKRKQNTKVEEKAIKKQNKKDKKVKENKE